MRTIYCLFGCCLLLSMSPVIAGSSAKVPLLKYVSPDAVTVFEDRARVHRRLAVEVGVGSSEVFFFGLPASLDPTSVRARLSGVSGLVLGVRLEREVHVEDVQQDVRLLVQAIQQLNDQLLKNTFRVEELDRRRVITLRLAKILEDSFSARGTEDLLGGGTSAQIITAQQWIADRLLELTLEKDRLQLQRDEIEKKRQDLSNDLEPLRVRQQRTTWSATVLIQTQEQGEATVELAHDVHGAGWDPIHEASLDEAQGEVKWLSKAEVIQHSGEDWNDVQLTLSTARSSLGLTPPSLIPVRVEAIAHQADVRLAVERSETPGADSSLPDPSKHRKPTQQAEDLEDKQLVGATLDSGSGPARFQIRAQATIPADGSTHAVLIGEQTFVADLDYESVPLLSLHVYRRARLTNSGKAPLLAGTVRCFRDGAYVGDGTVQRTAAGQQFTQHFGSEGRIVVHKEEIEDRSTKARSFSSNMKLVKAYRITVRSMIPESIPLELVDRIPVSSVDGVEVVLGGQTAPEPAVDVDGIVRWTMSLAKDQEQVFVLQWIATAEQEDAAILEELR